MLRCTCVQHTLLYRRAALPVLLPMLPYFSRTSSRLGLARGITACLPASSCRNASNVAMPTDVARLSDLCTLIHVGRSVGCSAAAEPASVLVHVHPAATAPPCTERCAGMKGHRVGRMTCEDSQNGTPIAVYRDVLLSSLSLFCGTCFPCHSMSLICLWRSTGTL